MFKTNTGRMFFFTCGFSILAGVMYSFGSIGMTFGFGVVGALCLAASMNEHLNGA